MKSKAQTFHPISLKLYQIILTPITITIPSRIIIQMDKLIKNQTQIRTKTKMFTNLLYRFTPPI
jgi:hypothetical protein